MLTGIFPVPGTPHVEHSPPRLERATLSGTPHAEHLLARFKRATLHLKRLTCFASCLGLAVSIAACGAGKDSSGKATGTEEKPASVAETIRLSSSAFDDDGPIPTEFTCDGGSVSPPLKWSGVPKAARGLALVLEDPDAPGGTFVHWVLYNIKPGIGALDTGAAPASALQGLNDFGDAGYGGPCPPEGDSPHHYRFTIYALESKIETPEGSPPNELLTDIKERAIAEGSLTGLFGRG